MALLDVVKKGTADYSATIRIVDSTDGTPETGVVFNTTGIDLWYRRPGSAHTSITEVTQTEAGAHTDGGFIHISDGEYRLDLPDAAVATGVDYVDIGGTVTGMVVIGGRIRLTDADIGTDGSELTALPNVTLDLTQALGTPAADTVGDGLKQATREQAAKKNVALNNVHFKMVSSTDNKTGATGLTFSASEYKQDAATTWSALTNSPTEVDDGVYFINLTQAEMNADVIVCRFAASGANDQEFTISTVE